MSERQDGIAECEISINEVKYKRQHLKEEEKLLINESLDNGQLLFMESIERPIDNCSGCGHNYFYDVPADGDLCHWCVDERDNPPKEISVASINYGMGVCPECQSGKYINVARGEHCEDCNYYVYYP